MASGKTTLADWLGREFGYKTLTLAGPIKEIEKDLRNGVAYADIISKHLADYPLDKMQIAMIYKIFDEANKMPIEEPKPRKRLQFIGTEGFRTRIDKDFWIKLAHFKTQTGGPWVIDDIRFMNEYLFFMNEGWKVIGLSLPAEAQMERLKRLYGEFDPSILTHGSEVEIDQILKENIDVFNTDRPTDLKEKLIRKVLEMQEVV